MSLAPRTMKMISGLLLCLGFFCCAGTSPRLGSLMTFEMEDQFRHSHSHADFKGRLLVVIGSDREGAPAAENWGKALSQSLKPERDSGRLNLIGLSTLKGVPFFLKDYGRRIEIATGNLLLFIAFSWSLGDNYPRMGYLTFVDAIMAITFFINTLVVALNVYYKWLENNGQREKADRLEAPMNYIYPLAYLVSFGLAALIFLR